MRIRRVIVPALLAVCVRVANGAEPTEITAILAGQVDSMLAGVIQTRGLPGHEAEDVLTSGLPSLLVIRLQVAEARGRSGVGVKNEIQIEPDLFEGGFLLRFPGNERRVASLDGLRENLRRIGPIPISDLRRWNPTEAWRLRAGLTVHPLAPVEVERVHSLFAGEERPADRREVSIGLGGLFRRILGGGRRPMEILGESEVILPGELPDWRETRLDFDHPPAPEQVPATGRN